MVQAAARVLRTYAARLASPSVTNEVAFAALADLTNGHDHIATQVTGLRATYQGRLSESVDTALLNLVCLVTRHQPQPMSVARRRGDRG